VDASVIDRNGRSIATLKPADFTLFEDGAQQTLDLVQLQRMPTQFTLLIDGSQSMSRRIDLVHATARRITKRLRLGDMVTVAPFRREVEAMTGPTDDEATIAAAIRRHSCQRRHRDPGFARLAAGALCPLRKAVTSSCW
jgi:hypothetical protein